MRVEGHTPPLTGTREAGLHGLGGGGVWHGDLDDDAHARSEHLCVTRHDDADDTLTSW